ncbi:MAG: hypothetical protein JSU81_08465 [Candidatus Coatesbacteria bacterium]|nr:MAG: hypothetical protein JSU81_08465 [Candidatus Coatesbacteria bacterium]
MILLLIALLLLPTAMLPREELYPVERVEVEARDASLPAEARRAVVVTRTGGKSPIKVLNVKIYEKEAEFKTVRVEYIVVYHTRDYLVAQRLVDFESFERIWLELNKNRVFTLEDAPEGPPDGPTFTVRVKEVKRTNTFTVTGPEAQEDPRYVNVIAAVEDFWQEQLEIP